MGLVGRDYYILREVGRWRFCLGRHVKELVNFSGSRACDRRLKVLIDLGYLERKKIMYGLPSFYTLTYNGRLLIGMNKRADKVRVENIQHNISVIDTAIYFIKKYGLYSTDITTEKEIQSKKGFGTRKHCPDFVFVKDDKKYAVEVELSIKTKDRLEKNITDNYLNYDRQIWVVPKDKKKIIENIGSYTNRYSNIELINLEVVNQGGKTT